MAPGFPGPRREQRIVRPREHRGDKADEHGALGAAGGETFNPVLIASAALAVAQGASVSLDCSEGASIAVRSFGGLTPAQPAPHPWPAGAVP